MSEDESSFGKKLQHTREQADLDRKEVASLFGVTARTVLNWETGESMPRDADPGAVLDKIRHLHENTGSSNIAVSETSETQRDPIYRLSTHPDEKGRQIDKRPIGHVQGEEALSRPGREVFWIFIGGDSMGRSYRKQSLVPVLKFQSGQSDIQEDDVYLVRLEGAVQLKRLQRLSNQRIRVISDNEAYPNTVLQIDQDVDFEVLGRVLV